uniref:HAT C-terminal dimerisation domain-containing protein n=1 Tax=Cuerna arida TaxID=1464854 RepID=A0A1B6G9G7_9HEMI
MFLRKIAKSISIEGFFIPWVDCIISNLNLRFTKHKDILGNFNCLLPLNGESTSSSTTTNIHEKRKTQFLKLVDFYKEDLDFASENSILSEYELWNEKFQRHEDSHTSKQGKGTVFNNAFVALNSCDETFFPNVNVLLRVLCTIPVTTCAAERSFSTLKRVKSYLRNSMKESRLNGLASLNIHREITVEPDEVIKILLLKGPRKLNFVL